MNGLRNRVRIETDGKLMSGRDVAIAALLGQHGEELELWCSNREDEAKFLHMFQDNPEMM